MNPGGFVRTTKHVMRIKQTLIFVGLALTLLYTYHAQRTPQNNQPKPKSWEIAFEQPFEEAYRFSEGLAVIKSGDKYGYIDKTGSVVIEPQFEYAWDFSEGLALVTSPNRALSYIDRNGNFVIEPQVDAADSFSEGLALVLIDKRHVYIRLVKPFVALQR